MCVLRQIQPRSIPYLKRVWLYLVSVRAHVVIEEKRAFLEMLHFIYTSSFSHSLLNNPRSWEELLHLLLVSDFYQVNFMIGAVVTIVKELFEHNEVVLKSAFDLPENLLQNEEIKGVMEQARASLFQRYKQVTTWDEPQYATLSVEVINFLLQNDELQCTSEEEVFERTLNWTRKGFKSAESRKEVMSVLSSNLRFAQMSGEFLQEKVMYDPDMQSSASQKHIREGLLYKWSSETRKVSNTEERFIERIGVEKPWTFEITCKARIDTSAGQDTLSPVCESRGTKWYVRVTKDTQTDPRGTMGVYLHESSLTRKELAQGLKYVYMEFSAKCRTTGVWTKLGGLCEGFFNKWRRKGMEGCSDLFRDTWDSVRVDQKWVDAAGDIEVRVETTVQRFLKEPYWRRVA